MSLRYHEIAEAGHRILNPITLDKLMLLGEVCRVRTSQRHLDLCCGKGELLCQWAKAYGITGTGVDISGYFLGEAAARAQELGVAGALRFVRADAATYAPTDGGDDAYDIVSCIGATWIGDGLVGTLDLMRRAVHPDGLLLVGEPYWITEPPDAAYESMGVGRDQLTSLYGTLERIESTGGSLVEMVLADGDSWDRYVAPQWWTITQWLAANPDDPDAEAMREFLDLARRSHLAYGRQYLGWGVFVVRP